jgi:hypothetical protein
MRRYPNCRGRTVYSVLHTKLRFATQSEGKSHTDCALLHYCTAPAYACNRSACTSTISTVQLLDPARNTHHHPIFPVVSTCRARLEPQRQATQQKQLARPWCSADSVLYSTWYYSIEYFAIRYGTGMVGVASATHFGHSRIHAGWPRQVHVVLSVPAELHRLWYRTTIPGRCTVAGTDCMSGNTLPITSLRCTVQYCT